MSNTNSRQHTQDLFQIRGLQKHFPVRGGGILSSILGESKQLKAVDDVSFNIREGEILGVAGQSGCGKSTLGELLLQLESVSGGQILFDGEDISSYSKQELKEFRRRCQVIFQDPYESLNPRFTVSRIVSEPLEIHDIGTRDEKQERVTQALEDAGLEPAETYLHQRPQELSGGQRQRVCIARAIVLDPDFLVADEPVSMLDVSVRSGILNLFKQLQEERDLTMVYISHDLTTIDYLADRTMIMYSGKIVEIGQTSQLIASPSHPYTESLLDAVPTTDPGTSREGSKINSEVRDPVDLPDGCRFAPDCKYAQEKCKQREPDLEPIDDHTEVACYYPVKDT